MHIRQDSDRHGAQPMKPGEAMLTYRFKAARTVDSSDAALWSARSTRPRSRTMDFSSGPST
jgi:hypothetical protein